MLGKVICDMHRQMIGLHSNHGKLARTGTSEVSVSDLGAIMAIYGWVALYFLSLRWRSAKNSF
jgi:hypothetical protein